MTCQMLEDIPNMELSTVCCFYYFVNLLSEQKKSQNKNILKWVGWLIWRVFSSIIIKLSIPEYVIVVSSSREDGSFQSDDECLVFGWKWKAQFLVQGRWIFAVRWWMSGLWLEMKKRFWCWHAAVYMAWRCISLMFWWFCLLGFVNFFCNSELS